VTFCREKRFSQSNLQIVKIFLLTQEIHDLDKLNMALSIRHQTNGLKGFSIFREYENGFVVNNELQVVGQTGYQQFS